MPRTKLSPDYWKRYGRDLIREKSKQKDIAVVLGKSQQAVSKKMETMNFSIEEFREVIKLTGMTDEQVLRIIK